MKHLHNPLSRVLPTELVRQGLNLLRGGFEGGLWKCWMLGLEIASDRLLGHDVLRALRDLVKLLLEHFHMSVLGGLALPHVVEGDLSFIGGVEAGVADLLLADLRTNELLLLLAKCRLMVGVGLLLLLHGGHADHHLGHRLELLDLGLGEVEGDVDRRAAGG